MKILGLTGGIGSGKSTVANLFLTLGVPIFDSDRQAKDLMNTDPDLIDSITNSFGPQAYQNGQLDRAWIAAQVFNSPPQLQQLNAIVHPAVKAAAMKWAQSPERKNLPYGLKESAILFEENLTQELDAVILVVAPTELRIDRVMKRDHISRDQILSRMQYQWEDDQKIPLSDYVIFNDGQRSLIEQVMEIDRMIKAL